MDLLTIILFVITFIWLFSTRLYGEKIRDLENRLQEIEGNMEEKFGDNQEDVDNEEDI